MSNSLAEEKVTILRSSQLTAVLISSHPVTGVLKGFDQLLNLVLDDVEELLLGNYATNTTGIK